MNEVVRLLADLAVRKVEVGVEDGRVRCSGPPGALTDELRAEVLRLRDDVIETLGPRRPLSFTQERLWLLHQLDPDDSAYHIPLVVELTGTLSAPALEQALDAVRQRHEILRTVYTVRRGIPGQVVTPHHRTRPAQVDLRGVPVGVRDRHAATIVEGEAARRFDLARGPVMRAVLLRLGDREHRLVITRHHIASDGWSHGLLLTELAHAYGRYVAGEPTGWVPLREQFGDVALRERVTAALPAHAEATHRWVQRLRDAVPTLPIVGAGPRGTAGIRRAERRSVRLDTALAGAVDRLARDRRVTTFTVLLTALGSAIAALSDQPDLVIGSAVAGRSRAGLDQLIGCFAGLLPIRLDLSGPDRLDRVNQAVRAAVADQDVPLQEIVDRLRPERSLTDTPLFQAVLAMQNLPTASVALDGLTVRVLPGPGLAPKYPLLVTVTPGPDGTDVEFETDPARIGGGTVDALARGMQDQLHALVGDPGHGPAHRTVRATAPPGPAAEAVPGVGLVDAVAAHALAMADRIATADGTEHLTYSGLSHAAARLAATLARRGVGTDVVVAVHARRRIDVLVAILGILRAGGAYVAVEPGAPARRTRAMLAELGVTVLVARPDEDVPGAEALDRVDPRRAGDAESPVRPRPPDALTSVVLTSGSTGRPKAIGVTDRGTLNYLHWCVRAYGVEADTWSLVSTPVSFDLTMTTLLAPLLVGGTVHLVDGVGPEEAATALLCGRHGLLKLTPAHLDLVAELLTARGTRLALHTIVAGGAAVSGRQLRPWADIAPRAAVVNEYGPAEAVVGCNWARWGGPDDTDPVPVGASIAGAVSEVRVGRHLAPVGALGELRVGGAAMTRGYVGQPAATAAVFVPDPAPSRPGAVLFRTGDLVRIRSDGQADYVGRRDRQVELRGHRIERGEVESAVAEHPDVRACVVLLRQAGGRGQLVVYLTPDDGSAPDLGRLQAFLSDRLPRYMIPTAAVTLPDLPLTPNGKVDEDALPDPAPTTAAPDLRPLSDTETVVARLWAELLGRSPDQVGVHQDFFEAGGDSLLIVQLHMRIIEAFDVDLPVRRVYQSMDVAALAATIDDVVHAAARADLLRLLDEVENLPEEELRPHTG